jgi:RNA polymerase sigma-B factor
MPSPLLSDADVAALHRRYAAGQDRRDRDALLLHYDGLAVSLAWRFPSRREAPDDLVQVARLALIHAVDRFDPGRERAFSTFARATILGELKRHLRDHTWRVRPPRSLQENYLLVTRTVDDMTAELGRSPLVPELAARCGLTEEHVLEAMEVAYSVPVSLDDPGQSDDDGGTIDLPSVEAGFAHVDDYVALGGALEQLSERERSVLRMRFEDGLSQEQIGRNIGVSQMCVSRMLARTYAFLRVRIAPPRTLHPT